MPIETTITLFAVFAIFGGFGCIVAYVDAIAHASAITFEEERAARAAKPAPVKAQVHAPQFKQAA